MAHDNGAEVREERESLDPTSCGGTEATDGANQVRNGHMVSAHRDHGETGFWKWDRAKILVSSKNMLIYLRGSLLFATVCLSHLLRRSEARRNYVSPAVPKANRP
jgi:hypothetical protein